MTEADTPQWQAFDANLRRHNQLQHQAAQAFLAAAHEAAHPEQTPPDWTGENR